MCSCVSSAQRANALRPSNQALTSFLLDLISRCTRCIRLALLTTAATHITGYLSSSALRTLWPFVELLIIVCSFLFSFFSLFLCCSFRRRMLLLLQSHAIWCVVSSVSSLIVISINFYVVSADVIMEVGFTSSTPIVGTSLRSMLQTSEMLNDNTWLRKYSPEWSWIRASDW